MHPIRRFNRYAIAVSLVLLSARIPAATFTVDAYRNVLQRGVDDGAYRQLAVGWIDGSNQQAWYYGRSSRPDADTEFEIGAVTEVFTGLLLADAAYQGQLRLDGSLSALLPQGIAPADAALGKASLRDLATHRCALPPVPPNLFPVRINDPYADYDTDDLLRLVVNWRVGTNPVQTGYSPLDAALLGYVISQQLAKPYPLLLHDRVLAPLRLEHTGFADSDRLVSGYSLGAPTLHWHYRAMTASAGLRSTLADMLRFVQANLTPANSPLRAALLLARQSYANDGSLDYGLGWRMVPSDARDNAWPVVWAASRTGGFSSFIGYRSDLQQGLVLLGNTDTDLSATGLAWLRHGPAPPPPAAPVRLSPTDLASYTGLYSLDHDDLLVISNVSGTLRAQWAGQPAVALRALAPDVFNSPVGGYSLSFQRQAGLVNGVLVAHAGFNTLATRLSRRAPRLPRVPITVPAHTLTAMIGDYRLDARTLLQIARDGVGVSVQLSGRARMALTAFAPDRFESADGSMELTLRRDTKGSVKAVSLQLAGAQRIAPRVRWTAALGSTEPAR